MEALAQLVAAKSPGGWTESAGEIAQMNWRLSEKAQDSDRFDGGLVIEGRWARKERVI
jgi:hypothetical protein